MNPTVCFHRDNNVVWYPFSGPKFVNGRKTCPLCSSYTGLEASWITLPKLITPVFLVERINKITQKPFWGCPNFPRCKFSYQEPRIIYPNIFDYDEISCDDLQC